MFSTATSSGSYPCLHVAGLSANPEYHHRITNGPDASTLLVYAKTEPDKGSKGITTFM